MALKRLTIDGYGQIELNNCAFRRDGRIEAQCAPSGMSVVENGMLLAVDNVSRTVTYATATQAADFLPVALVYTAEHIYDERTPGLKNFAVAGSNDFYPRLGYLAVGDKFTDNCIAYDDSVYTTEDAFISALTSFATTPLYGGVCANGAIAVSSVAPTLGPKLRVIDYTTMPDGTPGVKFQCYTA